MTTQDPTFIILAGADPSFSSSVDIYSMSPPNTNTSMVPSSTLTRSRWTIEETNKLLNARHKSMGKADWSSIADSVGTKTPSQCNNKYNALVKRCKQGIVGVSINGKKFKAKISIRGEQIYLGTFVTPTEAAIVFDKAAIKYGRLSDSLNFPELFEDEDEDVNDAEEEDEDESEEEEEDDSEDDAEDKDEDESEEDDDGSKKRKRTVKRRTRCGNCDSCKQPNCETKFGNRKQFWCVNCKDKSRKNTC